MKNFKKGLFPFIIALSAISVSTSAAFYSVSGLSKLFAGAPTAVIIMAGSLEVAKLVIASLLYQYWESINKLLRVYLTFSAVILVLITSMGIYGFLSAAYQETYKTFTITQNEIEYLKQKEEYYLKDVARYDAEMERISNNISTLSAAKATQIQVKDKNSTSGMRTTVSTAELRAAQSRINIEELNRKELQAKRTVATDSLHKYQSTILELENNTETSSELGPLRYLTSLTGVSMDRIINWLLLTIIFVFDPLAISLVIAANFAFTKAYGTKEEIKKDPEEEEVIWEEIVPMANNGMEYTTAPMSTVTPTATQEENTTSFRKIVKILHKGPTQYRVLFEDGEEKWIDKGTIRFKKGKPEESLIKRYL